MMVRNLHTPVFAALALLSSPAFGGADEAPASNGTATTVSGAGAEGTAVAFDDQVTMTWVSGDHRFATIDGGFHQPGDTLADGGRVLDIQQGRVLIERDGVQEWVAIVTEPPSPPDALAEADAPVTPLSYLDHAIRRLQTDIDALSTDPANAERVEQLTALRDRLENGRARLRDDALDPASRPAIEAEMNEEWLLAQQRLDSLRQRVLSSPGGLGMEELRKTRDVLEQAVLATLREPLARLQDPEYQMVETMHSSDLLRMVGGLLGSYPDYQALAERLEGGNRDE